MTQKLNVTIEMTDDIMNQLAEKVAQKMSLPKPTTKNEVFTSIQVGEMLGKTQQTINKHIRLGLLVATKTGKSYSITLDNLNNYINGQH